MSSAKGRLFSLGLNELMTSETLLVNLVFKEIWWDKPEQGSIVNLKPGDHMLHFSVVATLSYLTLL